jgi:uncharacterized protein YwqG
MNKTYLQLQPLLEPYRKRFEKYLIPTVKLKLHPGLDATVFDSKLGGYPYLPLGSEFPKDSKGNYMCLLAQINFSEMPTLEDYPNQGILQFYISRAEDYHYGINPNDLKSYRAPNPQNDWRVLYFAEVSHEHQTDFSFLGEDESYWEFTPLDSPHYVAKEVNPDLKRKDNTYGVYLKIDFKKDMEPPLSGDYQFHLLLNTDDKKAYDFWSRFEANDKRLQVKKEYDEMHYKYGHKIGGYAGFSQEDPRTWNRNGNRHKLDKHNPWVLLLQLESNKFIMWGDCGVGH